MSAFIGFMKIIAVLLGLVKNPHPEIEDEADNEGSAPPHLYLDL